MHSINCTINIVVKLQLIQIIGSLAKNRISKNLTYVLALQPPSSENVIFLAHDARSLQLAQRQLKWDEQLSG